MTPVQPTVSPRALASGGRSAGVGIGSARRRAKWGELRAQQQLPGLPRELADQLSNTLASLPLIGQTVRAGGKDDGSGGPKNVIPGPAPLPMVGSSLDILRIGGLHKGFQQYAKEYGPVIKLQIGANSSFILIADPELTRQITTTDFQSFPNRNAPGGADGGVGETIKMDNATIAQDANGMPVAPPVASDKAKGAASGGSAGSGTSVREVFGQQAGVGVVAAVDDKWKAMRATAISSFGNPKLMREYSRIVSEETVALIRRLQPFARDSYMARDHQPSVDLSFWVRRLTTEVICRIAFSKRLGLVTGKLPEGEAVDETMQMSDSLQRFLGNAGRVGRYQPIFQAMSDVAKGSPLRSVLPDDMTASIPGLTQLRKDTQVMDQYEKGLIEKRREGQDLGTDLLGKMMLTTVAGAHGPLSDADVQANVREAFVAGSETTGAAIAITLHQISNNPRIEWLVRKELKEVLGDKTVPDHEDLERLPYLKMCIRETLRLYPSAHVFGRRAEKDIEVGGYLIKEGASVLMSPYYLGRDETQWGPDAHLYRPERHLATDALAGTRSKFAWMPFGAGPRMCLGASLAMTEATVCVAGMLQNFKIRPLSSKLKYDYLITIELEDGVPVLLTPLRPIPEPLSQGPEWVVQPAPKAAKAVPAP